MPSPLPSANENPDPLTVFHRYYHTPNETQLMIHKPCWEALMQHFRQETQCVSIDLQKLAGLLQVPKMYRGSIEIARESMGLDPPDTTPAEPKSRMPKYFRRDVLRSAEKTLPKMDPIINSQTGQRMVPNTDCFFRLPLELRLWIACLLPTSDMLHLRLASLAMAPIFHIESFWKSRFEFSMERGYLHFLMREDFTKWMVAYRCSKRPTQVNERRCQIGFQVGRQWIRYEQVLERYFMSQHLGPSTTSPARLTSLDWQTVIDANHGATGANQRWRIVSKKPRIGESQTVDLSEDILGLAVFVHSEGRSTIITGFELIYGSGKPNVIFGYRLPERQVTIDLNAYQWIGDPIQKCWSFRLAGSGSLTALTREFCAYRMLSLGVGVEAP
ncbi:hypothetical protein N7540_002500 [Penicillium herquei]|nr:hypothetical protein N7540_002500 [Penicillium herquei]